MHLLSARRVVGGDFVGAINALLGGAGFARDFALFRNRRPASAVIDRLCERRFMAKTARMRNG
jgi:hypothetical protein